MVSAFPVILKPRFFQVSFIFPCLVWKFRLLKRTDLRCTCMVSSDTYLTEACFFVVYLAALF